MQGRAMARMIDAARFCERCRARLIAFPRLAGSFPAGARCRRRSRSRPPAIDTADRRSTAQRRRRPGISEAMIVSANIAICTPAEPITAGPKVLKKCTIALSKRGMASFGARPLRRASAHTSSSSSTPATATPPGGSVARRGKQEGEAEAGDQREVQQDRRSRCGSETVMRVQER